MNDDAKNVDLPEDVLPDEITSRLSIFEKTTPELRRKLDRAILNYEPAGYREIYKKYNLSAESVSFTAFYRYASRLRARGAAIQLAAEVLKTDDAPSLVEILPDLIGQHLVEQFMANDQLGPDAIYKLTRAHRTALDNAELIRKRRATLRTTAPDATGRLTDSSTTKPLAAPPHRPIDELTNDELLAYARAIKAAKNRMDEQSPADPPGPLADSPPTHSSYPARDAQLPSSNSAFRNPHSELEPQLPNSSDVLVSTADDEMRQTPEQRRREEFLRVMLDFGFLRANDTGESPRDPPPSPRKALDTT